MDSITLQSIVTKASINYRIQCNGCDKKPDKNPQELSAAEKFSFHYSDHRDLSNSVCFGDHSKDEELIYIGHTWSRRASVCNFWHEGGNKAWKIQNTDIVESEYWLVRRVSGNIVGIQTPRMLYSSITSFLFQPKCQPVTHSCNHI